MKRITNKKWNEECILPIFLAFACCLLISSCRKDAGLGGNATLTVYSEHHGNVIINHIGYPDTVFLKYNADEFPGTKPSDYDAFFVGTPREEFIKIEGLKTGKYFVYAVAFDSTWSALGARVTGGMPLKIKRSQRDDNLTVRIPLSE
ncbi:MAG: hypothetical protein EPN85_14735 [Bacteroidetes bacterium]|nr:MAG: hypothetical protein EPN85_14735 [Bacteroidota bacterium]